MKQISPEGAQVVADLANRHGFSQEAVTHMMFAVLNGNGGMAQFNHFEFGGSGQWMSGGMTMLGDMFNSFLRGRVDSLCSEISRILASQPGLLQSGSFQSQSQGGSSYQSQVSGAPRGQSTLFVPDPEENWWPHDLGSPNATGTQNHVKYAYFQNARRLAVKTGSEVWVYDTQEHNIGGFSQQQGSGGSITFTSQWGTVVLSSLPLVSRNGQEVPPAASHASWGSDPASAGTKAPSATSNEGASVLETLERLGQLREKGWLSEQEFAAKKAELLSRL